MEAIHSSQTSSSGGSNENGASQDVARPQGGVSNSSAHQDVSGRQPPPARAGINNSPVLMWSHSPAVNRLAVQVIVGHLDQTMQHRTQTNNQGEATNETLDALVKSALVRLEGLQVPNSKKPDATGGAGTSSNFGQVQGFASETRKELANSDGTSTTASASQSTDSTSEGQDRDVTFERQSRGKDEGSSSSTSSSEGSIREAVTVALQQHLDILHQRGEVSAVIPSFLRSTNPTRPRDVHSSSSSLSSTHAVRSAKRRRKCITREQFYEDLAVSAMANSVPPIPKEISIRLPRSRDSISESEMPPTWSDISVSSGSSIGSAGESDSESYSSDSKIPSHDGSTSDDIANSGASVPAAAATTSDGINGPFHPAYDDPTLDEAHRITPNSDC